MSICDAAIKREAGRLRAPRNPSAILAAGFRRLDVTAELLQAAAELPRHRPFFAVDEEQHAPGSWQPVDASQETWENHLETA